MTKTYKYEFTRYITVDGYTTVKTETIKKTVTDSMESRDSFKAGYAASRINEDLRNKYGFKKSVARACDLKEIKRK